MNRRDTVLGLLALGATPLAVESQPAANVHRIGYLGQSKKSTDSALPGFQQGLRELGYVEGQNLIVEYRFAELDMNRLPALAAELVNLKVEVIAAAFTRSIEAAKRATTTIPIVMAGSLHAVESGFVASIAHPGGNITGVTSNTGETIGKELELLKETYPALTDVAVLWNPGFYNWKPAPQWRGLEAAAPRLRVKLHSIEIRKPGDVEGAFAAVARSRAQAVLILADPLTFSLREQISRLAIRRRLLVISSLRGYADAGVLMIYGPNPFESSRRAAVFVDKILKGARPADLPVEQPIKLPLVINLKTAKALRISIPQSLLVRADELIQ